MILDEVRALANQLGVKETPVPMHKTHGYNTMSSSIAAHLLAAIEQKLGLVPNRGTTVGQRLASVKATLDTGIKIGDRVEIDTPVLYRGQHATVVRIIRTTRVPHATVKLDKDGVERSFYLSNLKKLETNMTIANRVKTALSQLVPNTKLKTIHGVIKQLAAATVACTIANGAKDKAKKALVELGIADSEYREGTVTIFDDADFKVEAVTKAATSRLDQALLKAELIGLGVSTAKVNRAFAAATLDNKPATSFVVTEK